MRSACEGVRRTQKEALDSQRLLVPSGSSSEGDQAEAEKPHSKQKTIRAQIGGKSRVITGTGVPPPPFGGRAAA